MKKKASILRELYSQRELIKELARRDLVGQYKGQALGSVWTFIHPIVMILIYVFLFGIVFRSNTGFVNEKMPMPFTSYIICGMVPWLFLQRVLISGSSSIITNASAVKQVMVTPAVYPARSLYSSLILELIYLVPLIIYNLICIVSAGKSVPWTYAIVPVALLIQVLFGLGLSLFLSSITAYLRDIKDIMQVFTMICIYLMPVVYLPDAVPSIFRFILYVNPFSYFIWIFQDALYFGSIQHPFAWGISLVIAVLTFWLGNSVFNRLKVSFGSVL